MAPPAANGATIRQAGGKLETAHSLVLQGIVRCQLSLTVDTMVFVGCTINSRLLTTIQYQMYIKSCVILFAHRGIY